MRTKFYSDNALPCWRCTCTIVKYTTDTVVSLVDVQCIACGARDVFSCSPTPTTAAECSAAHRKINSH